MIEGFNKQLKTSNKNKANRCNRKYPLIENSAGYYEGREESWWNTLKDWF